MVTYVLMLIPVVEFSLFHLDFRVFVLGGKRKKGGWGVGGGGEGVE